MNLPNRITLFRIILVPVIMIIAEIDKLNFLLFYHVTCQNLIILILFLIATFSDFLDGYIARKRNLITNFGKFADPLADKILVIALLVILLGQGTVLKGYVVTIIVIRELVVTGMRLLAVEKGMVIAAGWLGKIKTNVQFLLIILLLINGSYQSIGAFEIITMVVMYLAVFFTVLSGIAYIVKNREIFKNEGKWLIWLKKKKRP